MDLAGVAAAAAEVANDCVETDAAVAIDDATWFFDLKNFLGVSAVTMILGLPVLVLDTLSHSARSSNLVIFVVVQGFQKNCLIFSIVIAAREVYGHFLTTTMEAQCNFVNTFLERPVQCSIHTFRICVNLSLITKLLIIIMTVTLPKWMRK